MAEDAGSEGPVSGTGKVDFQAIRQLLELMGEHGLVELEIEQDDLVVRLRKAGAAPVSVGMPMPTPSQAEAQPPAEKLPTINSPMVGTFYTASSPEADPHVTVGDHVSEDTVVCIIEAMKVFNEIRAEMSGTIEKVLVKNAEPVEFGAPMFVVRPD